MQRRIFETALGAVVLVATIGFGLQLFAAQEDDAVFYYPIKVYFESAQGLKEQSEVRLGGVRVGYVDKVSLNTNTLLVELTMEIRKGIELPDDSVVEIASQSLLGNAFVKIVPGQSEATVAENSVLTKTVSPVSLEDLLGRAIFALSNKS